MSAMVLVALSLGTLPSSVVFSKPNNVQYCCLQVEDSNKKVKAKYFSIHSFSLIKITSNTTKKKANKILVLSIVNWCQKDRILRYPASSTYVTVGLHT